MIFYSNTSAPTTSKDKAVQSNWELLPGSLVLAHSNLPYHCIAGKAKAERWTKAELTAFCNIYLLKKTHLFSSLATKTMLCTYHRTTNLRENLLKPNSTLPIAQNRPALPSTCSFTKRLQLLLVALLQSRWQGPSPRQSNGPRDRGARGRVLSSSTCDGLEVLMICCQIIDFLGVLLRYKGGESFPTRLRCSLRLTRENEEVFAP